MEVETRKMKKMMVVGLREMAAEQGEEGVN